MRSVDSLTKQLGRPPHVCFVAPQAFPLLASRDDVQFVGGAELQQVVVARELAARGYRVSMVGLDFGQPDEVTIDGITVFRAYRPTAGIPVLRFVSPRLTGIWRCLVRADADIYYQRTASMLAGVVAAYCRRHGKRSVFAAAGNPDLEPRTPRIRYARDRWLYGYGLRRVDRILVQNEEQASLCRVHWHREPVLVPNCLQSIPAMPWEPGRNVLWVSTIRRIKRPELFLDLASRLPNLDFEMIGGPDGGDPKLFEAIKSRAEGMKNVSFRGFVPLGKIEQEFDRAAVVVNTSESEGFPNAFLQSWSRGIPTVSFVDAGARHEGRPVGIRVGSNQQMVEVVAQLAASAQMRAEEGRRCRTYCLQTHSADRVLATYEQLFADLLNDGPGLRQTARFGSSSRNSGSRS